MDYVSTENRAIVWRFLIKPTHITLCMCVCVPCVFFACCFVLNSSLPSPSVSIWCIELHLCLCTCFYVLHFSESTQSSLLYLPFRTYLENANDVAYSLFCCIPLCFSSSFSCDCITWYQTIFNVPHHCKCWNDFCVWACTMHTQMFFSLSIANDPNRFKIVEIKKSLH